MSSVPVRFQFGSNGAPPLNPPVTAHFFWHGSTLSYYERQCLSSFVLNGFDVNLHTYNPDLLVPLGVRKTNAATTMPVDLIQILVHEGQKGSITAFADLFRYHVLAREPGWWFDIDFVCLKTAREFRELERQSQGLILAAQDADTLNNAVLYVSQAEIARQLATEALLRARNTDYRFPWGHLGPELVTRWAGDHPQLTTVLSPKLFYPIGFREHDRLFSPAYAEECRTQTDGSFGIHLWNEVLRRFKIPKDLAPCSGSYLGGLFSSQSPWTEDPPPLSYETFHRLVTGR